MTRLRCATVDDLPAILDVSVRNGLSAFDPDCRRRWWLEHPFRNELEGVPMGWVLENESGRIVGTLTNVPMLYELAGRPLKCAIASSWAVDPDYRSSSLLLTMSYFTQTRVDLLINGSANETAARVMSAFGAHPIPAPDYNCSYFWILRPRAFATAALERRQVPGARWLSLPAALLLALAAFPGRLPRKPAAEIRHFDSFGEEFDRFWEKLRRHPGRLVAVRTAEALKWRFSQAWWPEKPIVVGAVRDGELLGYLVLVAPAREHSRGLRNYLIGDLQALGDSPAVVRTLLRAGLRAARRRGAGSVQWIGWAPQKRQAAVSLFPRKYRTRGHWPLYYRVASAELKSALSEPDCWDFSPFDAF
jgi:hypothetical protein